MTMELDQTYWQHRYLESNTPWDIGYASPPLKDFIDTLKDQNMQILVPGAGRAYEAIYLHRKGFQQVFVCDWADKAFDFLRVEAPDFPEQNLICRDFFELNGVFDLILEQTFFCAISPSLRGQYVSKAASLLRQGGSLAGLLFANPFETEGPPFGGTENEYRKLFTPTFEVFCLEMAKNSILPRSQNELFFQLFKK
ncbi:MAG: SAM-dependent methyltransferase [Saprospiraceae bacterium]|nr:SAM-dependent methyltransferase [Saprospiraceae bacterium]MCF8248594.1 SAM-dependent methyltransferase [Saprospiraceae bacterium]MCF8281032.1 hypothetical protein [Bacteroidales bacterium]MCF8310327.1 SAM-dependent methyltransferase [Saprospiraceae bacterium]MCF8442092.1 SAM-dependent methyltransferase [Saprospiraceae bacterium]